LIIPKISFGEKKVIASGRLIMPTDELSVRIGIDDLDFLVEFPTGGDLSQGIVFNTDGNTLRVVFRNPSEKPRMGFTKTFLPVGIFNGETLGLIMTVNFLPSKAKSIDYTFITLGVNKDASDD